MRYRVKTKWITVEVPGLGSCFHPACHIDGIHYKDSHGDAAEGKEFEMTIDCDPSLIPAVEATGTVILETLGE